jgi:hypothetical protein
MSEQRLTDELMFYWNRLKQGKQFPSEDQIDQQEIQSIWQNCFLVKLEGDRFRYEILGDSIIQAYADNKIGEDIIEDQLYPESPGILNKFLEVARTKEPVYYEGVFVNKDNLDVKFRKILLPLGSGNEVEYILGGMRWKSMDLYSM